MKLKLSNHWHKHEAETWNAKTILTAHLPITSRNVGAVATQIEAYLQANAPRIMAQKTSPAKQDASRRNGLYGGKPRKYELQPGDVVMLRKSAAADRYDETAVVSAVSGVYVFTVPGLSEWNPWHVSELKRVKRVVQRTK